MALPSRDFDRVTLRRLRQQRGLTQAELARKVDVGEDTVYEWEAGKSRPLGKRSRDLAAALSVAIDDLYRSPGGRGHLKDLRTRAGLTQTELVDTMNAILKSSSEITQSKISNWERAKTQIPQEYAASYAVALQVAEEELSDAARDTWKDAHKMESWTPLVDQRQRDFKGVAAGSAELEFIYALSSRAYSLTEIASERTVSLHQSGGVESDSPDELFLYNIWHQVYLTIKDIRERSVVLINQNRGIEEDVAERARSVIWTLDQYFTIAEDMLGLPREKLTAPTDMFGRSWQGEDAKE